MPTLNAYKNNSGYYIRAWLRQTGFINYKLTRDGWRIIDDWSAPPSDGEITWLHIKALKSVGVIYTDETGIIYPDDEEYQPHPDLISEANLTESEARSFLEAILSNCTLSSEQIANLCEILGVEPPTDEITKRFEPAVESVKDALKNGIVEGSIPVAATLPLSTTSLGFIPPGKKYPDPSDVEVLGFVSGPEDVERGDPEFERGYDKNTLGITITTPETSGTQSRDFLLHLIFFDEEQVTAWSTLSSQELTWEVRSELYGQISTMLPVIVEALSDSETKIAETPSNFEISFNHDPKAITSA